MFLLNGQKTMLLDDFMFGGWNMVICETAAAPSRGSICRVVIRIPPRENTSRILSWRLGPVLFCRIFSTNLDRVPRLEEFLRLCFRRLLCFLLDDDDVGSGAVVMAVVASVVLEVGIRSESSKIR